MAYDRKQGGHEVAQSSRPDYRLEVPDVRTVEEGKHAQERSGAEASDRP